MNEIALNRPNRQKLENAKLAVQKIADKRPLSPTLDKFKAGTTWYGVSEKVTGQDMNLFVTNMQNLIFRLNQDNIETYKQFATVYSFFDILDNEYIKYFNKSIDKLNIVSDKNIESINIALRALERIDKTIPSIKQTIEKLNSTKTDADYKISSLNNKIVSFENDIITKLHQLNRIEEIKRSLESYEHFVDIDIIWEDVQNHKAEILALSSHLQTILNTLQLLRNHKDRIENIEHIYDIDMMWEDVEILTSAMSVMDENLQIVLQGIKPLEEHKKRIESFEHLNEIDSVWQDVQNHGSNILDIKNNIESISEDINVLEQHKNRIESFEHLNEIDSIWQDVQNNIANILYIEKEMQNIQYVTDSLHNENEKLKKEVNSLNERIVLQDQRTNKKINTLSVVLGGGIIIITLLNFFNIL